MSDSTLNRFLGEGDDAQQAAFTPSPPTPASGPDSACLFVNKETLATPLLLWWNGSAFVQVGGGAGGGLPANVQGDIFYSSAANTVSTLAKDANATRYLSNTGASNNPAWDQVELTNGVSGILPVANGGTGVSASFSARLMTEVTLTDAQVKALPTTPVQLVAAPSAGTYIEYEKVVLITKFSGGAYTNLAAVSFIEASVNGVGFTTIIANDNTTTPNFTQLTRFMGAASRRAVLLPYLEGVDHSSNQDYVTTASVDGLVGVDPMSSFDAGNMSLFADNGAGGDFTGGNAANTLIARVYYTLNTVP